MYSPFDLERDLPFETNKHYLYNKIILKDKISKTSNNRLNKNCFVEVTYMQSIEWENQLLLSGGGGSGYRWFLHCFENGFARGRKRRWKPLQKEITLIKNE